MMVTGHNQNKNKKCYKQYHYNHRSHPGLQVRDRRNQRFKARAEYNALLLAWRWRNSKWQGMNVVSRSREQSWIDSQQRNKDLSPTTTRVRMEANFPPESPAKNSSGWHPEQRIHPCHPDNWPTELRVIKKHWEIKTKLLESAGCACST